MTRDRALDIIAACGADPARWPADERAGVLALSGDPAVAAALAEAAPLDALLTEWARAEGPVRSFDPAKLVPAPAAASAPAPRRRWFAAGALAAAVAAAVALTPMRQATSGTGQQIASVSPQTPVPSATATSEAGDADFAYVFTPTIDEDALI
ncbi:hypothetical protein [Polymorphobacter fuscus]|uniref:Uncharacterized protein n=1 Tax=Sandarakinorhabdus fusca TaxID=1439888 RepID=A0A7C9LGM0_9SPHN|nr:hypothetical protein [Polymorphobacter fuscus]KAB7646359.1 hypothetical protein F9290_09965 [Polymorphobacter fuscus]MQT17587.1 hypothetical protein [Polymorphobacter fuscus]NJC09870.1 hypothetical protein [Polymorphobacter fuscus]